MRNEKFELDIQIPPPILSYLPISILSSIAAANQRDNSWILNNFIQLYIPEEKRKLESFPFQDFMYYDQNLFQVNNVNDNNHIFLAETIIREIIYWIEHYNYVVVYVDEYEIPYTNYYQKFHMLHSQLIYGYDLKTQNFLAVNFLQDGKIGTFYINFKILENAIFSQSTQKLFIEDITWNSRKTEHKVILIRYLVNREKFYDHGINREYILNEIKNYYYSINSSDNTCFFTGKLYGTWGMKIYTKIIDFLGENQDSLDYRMFHLLYEHKIFMFERLKLFETDDKYSSNFVAIIQNADIARKLCMKYNLTKNKDILVRMIDLIKKIKREEQEILYEFLKEFNLN